MRATRDRFHKVERKGALLVESDAVIHDLEERLSRVLGAVGDQFPTMLARNLFLSVGIATAMRRRGNNNLRMDLILGPPAVERGVAEVEFGDAAILEAPRDALDAVAVLVSRYGWDRARTVVMVVGDVMPNRRSEYWRIIQDLDRVLGVRIGTISILALMLAVWNRMQLRITPRNAFYADSDTGPYRTGVLESMIGRPLRLSARSSSLVEPVK